MTEYSYKEYTYVQDILKAGFITKYNYYESSLLCKFWAGMGLDIKDVEENLIDFCSLYNEDFNYAIEYKTIDKAVNSAFGKNNKLIQIDYVPIYKHEVEYIKNVDLGYNYERLMFAFLVLKKIHSAIWKINSGEDKISGYLNGDIKQAKMLKEMAHLTGGKKDDIDYMIYDLAEKGYVNRLSLGKDYLVFIDELSAKKSEEIIRVYDFEKVWMYYEYISKHYRNSKIMICKDCGTPEYYTSKTCPKKYCEKCSKKRKKEALKKFKKKNKIKIYQ